MLSDLLHIDILNLIGANDWTEEHKSNLRQQYAQSLAAYLEDKLRDHLSPKEVEKLDTLAEDPKTSDKTLLTFYKDHITNLPHIIGQISQEFKKEFLIKVYDRYCAEFVNEIKI